MSVIPVNLAVEDELSEAVIRRMLSHVRKGYAVGTAYGRTGNGYLKKTIHGWNNAAVGIPFIVLTDLDRYPCPPVLIEEWLPPPRHPNLLFRVAVRTVEAWLLADRVSLPSFLGVVEKRIPVEVDSILNPKAALIEVARLSKFRDVRERVVPKRGSTARQGPDYNGFLSAFVASKWNLDSAALNSPSLARTLQRLRVFVRYGRRHEQIGDVMRLTPAPQLRTDSRITRPIRYRRSTRIETGLS